MNPEIIPVNSWDTFMQSIVQSAQICSILCITLSYVETLMKGTIAVFLSAIIKKRPYLYCQAIDNSLIKKMMLYDVYYFPDIHR